MKLNTKKTAHLSLAIALAMILSYIELLIPPLITAVPGIKIGLPNVIIIFVLVKFGIAEAVIVSLIRVFLSSLLFGTSLTLAYSVAGAVLSLLVMSILVKTRLPSTIGVSIAGGVFHNAGQTLMAILILGTKEIAYYMAVLAVSGTVSGIFVGILASLMIKHIKKI